SLRSVVPCHDRRDAPIPSGRRPGLTPAAVHARVTCHPPTRLAARRMQKPTLPTATTPAADPASVVDDLARTGRKVRTPCGDGSMVWRVWGAGEPLLLFHGGSGSWTHWIRTIPVLSQHYELWVPDIPGLGDSAMPPEPRTPSTLADIVVTGLRDLLPAAPKLRIAGFSFGGHVAGLTALRLQERVHSLTL